MRQTEDQTWCLVAAAIAGRSKCDTQVGAVIVGVDGRVLATGYNGPPAGYKPVNACGACSGICDRKTKVMKDPDYLDCPSNHAEINALLYSDQVNRANGVIYVTKMPCLACAKAIANSGLHTVVVSRETSRINYDPQGAVHFLKTCGLVVEFYNEEAR